MHSFLRGYTLTELLLVSSIAALLLGLAQPSLRSSLQSQDGDALVNDLARSMNVARARAVELGSIVTLCASRDAVSCSGNWQDGHIVFIDADGDGSLTLADTLVHAVRRGKAPGELVLRSFPKRKYVQFIALGSTRNQNGTFTWCPPSSDASLARQLIFSASGRMRLAIDRDGDGIREGSNGKPLDCGV
jgi:type IV fimbrial biogenesis protein FimT